MNISNNKSLLKFLYICLVLALAPNVLIYLFYLVSNHDGLEMWPGFLLLYFSIPAAIVLLLIAGICWLFLEAKSD